MQPHDFVEVFVRPLEELGVEYLITGSIAAIFYGEPRLTHDIDLVLILRSNHVDLLCNRFSLDEYYCPPPEVLRVELGRSHHAHFNLIHHASGFKADCYLFTGDELHRWAFEHRREVKLGPGAKIQLAPIEYVIIRKLQYFREGGSPKHLIDIQAMQRISGSDIDEEFLARELRQRGLIDLLPKIPQDL